MKKYLVALLGCIAALFCFTQKNSNSSSYFNDTIETTQPSTSSSATLEKEITQTKLKAPNNYHSCQQLIASEKETHWNWAREQEWDQWLDKGYSIDDITLAIDHFLNSNFAANWRAKMLKKNSQLNQQNQSLTEQVKALVPDLPSFVLIGRSIPQSQIENIATLSQADALALIKETKLTIDDVDWLLKQDSLSQQLLLQAIENIDDTDAFIGFGIQENETLHLIDTAAYYGRDQIVTTLLEKNSVLSDDAYLGTTMEYALDRLDDYFHMNIPLEDDLIVRQVKIIKALHGLNSTANFSIQSDQKAVGFFPRHGYSFDAQQMTNLQQMYGLTLTEIRPKTALTFDPNSALLTELNTNFAQLHANSATPEAVADCQSLVHKIDSQWQPHNLSYFSDKLIKEGKEVTASNLNHIDPALTDCFNYQQRQPLPRRQSGNHSLDNTIYGLAAQNKINEAIKMVEDAQLEEAVNREFFYQLLGYNPEYFTELQLSQLRQETFNYDALYRMAHTRTISLISEGLDIDKLDYTGKSWLDIAIMEHDLPLLNYLVNQHISYPYRESGRDPLYLLLDTNHYKFNPEHLLEYLSLLMVLEPKVYPQHQRLMSLIRLKFPESYTQITNQFPTLIAKEDIPLPPAVCLNY
ncbi:MULTISPECIES: hypothetical protein [Shewanella]|uniref:hypothetical protein n=1 Tax=Shewanella TaxID=22 RepID=UPI0001E10AFE|nr:MULTISPECIES: hypothetical protein [Shewanella]AEG13013.1 hypothetical protein Sbal175_3788 [Shewanella baltica BA175]EHQ13444.1 hypothetical protein Sbal183_0509 [Shewanella baltica OS183]OUS50632.1 hypothetical protein BM607_017975 [Shewanella sp. SACH]